MRKEGFPIKISDGFSARRRTDINFVTAKPKRSMNWFFWINVSFVFAAVMVGVMEYL